MKITPEKLASSPETIECRSLPQPRNSSMPSGSASGRRLRALSCASLMNTPSLPPACAPSHAARTSAVICLRKAS